MQPWGSRGMIRLFQQLVWYPDYDGRTSKLYKVEEKQKGPRGRLPLCPDTCFVTGGAFPSNGLPDDAGPEGAGIDYYDLLKGDTEDGTREPPPDIVLSEQSGPNFHAHISDIKSGDTKWWSDSSGVAHILFVGANRKAYCYKAASTEGAGVKVWDVDIATSMLSEFPLSTGEGTSVQRTWRIDPKRSVVVGDKFLVLVSFCDWEIRPGKGIVFSSDPALKSTEATINPDKYGYYPSDSSTGEITGYNAQTRTMPTKLEAHVTHNVTVDDSVRIIHYAHYFMVINLTGTTRVDSSIPIHEEFLCGKMDLVVQPQVREQGVYFKAKEAVHNYAMEAATYALIFPDGVWQLVAKEPATPQMVPAPQCASTLGVNISSLDLTLPVEPVWCAAHDISESPPLDAQFICTAGAYPHLNDHWHVPNNTPGHEYGFAERGAAKGTAYKWTNAPDDNDFAWVSPNPDILELSSESGHAGAVQWESVTVPTNEQVAEELHEIDDELDLYEYPSGDNILIQMLGSGNWNWCQGNFATCWDRYDADQYSFWIVTPSIGGWAGDTLYYEAGNTKLHTYKPVPYEWTRWKRGKELVGKDVYENCLSTDSSFSDISVFPITEVVGEETVTKHVIAFLRWGANANPFESSSTITDDPPDTEGDKYDFTASPTQAQKNNNPCTHRQARLANKLNLCLLVLEDMTLTSFEIPITDAMLACGEWAGDPYEWVPAETYDLKSHDEVRPLSVWDEAENKVVASPAFTCSLMSADSHVQGVEAGASYNASAVLGGGSGNSGRQQQLVIPLKMGTQNLGKGYFLSCIGLVDGNVRYSNWQQGVGDAQWADIIHGEMQANRRVGGWMLINIDGQELDVTYQPENSLSAGDITSPWFCRWACYVELVDGESTKEWVVIGMQYIDYQGESNITCKFKVYALDVSSKTTTIIRNETVGHLHTGAAVTPNTNRSNATVFFSYSLSVDNTYGIMSSNIIDPSISRTANGPYDQIIVESAGGTRYLLCLKAGSSIDILDLSDLSLKKTIPSTSTSMSSGGTYRLATRDDLVEGDKVKTRLSMMKY